MKLTRLSTIKDNLKYGVFDATVFISDDKKEYLVYHMGDLMSPNVPIVRIHSQCISGEVFLSNLCDCRLQLHGSLQMIADEQRGIVIYMYDEGRGLGLPGKLESINLEQTSGIDTVEAYRQLGYNPDLRDYTVAVDILKTFAITSVRLVTNNPKKKEALVNGGINVEQMIGLNLPITSHAIDELKVKRDKLGHFIFLQDEIDIKINGSYYYSHSTILDKIE